MALYLAVVAQRRRRQNVPRVFRDRQHPLEVLNDEDLLKKYRFDRQSIFELCALLQDDLRRPTRRCQPLSVSLHVLVALRFYAQGSFQGMLAQSHGITSMSVPRIIHTVSQILATQVHDRISFTTDQDSLRRRKQRFYAMGGFPNVIGAVDGTLIGIKTPSLDEHLYVSRKGGHSINVQGICDADNVFLNVVVRWPGSTHDAFMWNNCQVVDDLERLNLRNTWLPGDSAYPLKSYLLTPIMNPQNAAQRSYNAAHERTRCVIERTFGIWKMRFRCLDKSAGYLTYSPNKCAKIICATAFLHNKCTLKRLPYIPDDDEPDEAESDDESDEEEDDLRNERDNADGRQTSESVIRNYFAGP